MSGIRPFLLGEPSSSSPITHPLTASLAKACLPLDVYMLVMSFSSSSLSSVAFAYHTRMLSIVLALDSLVLRLLGEHHAYVISIILYMPAACRAVRASFSVKSHEEQQEPRKSSRFIMCAPISRWSLYCRQLNGPSRARAAATTT